MSDIWNKIGPIRAFNEMIDAKQEALNAKALDEAARDACNYHKTATASVADADIAKRLYAIATKLCRTVMLAACEVPQNADATAHVDRIMRLVTYQQLNAIVSRADVESVMAQETCELRQAGFHDLFQRAAAAVS